MCSDKKYHDKDRKTDNKYADTRAHGTDGGHAQFHGGRVTCVNRQHRSYADRPRSRRFDVKSTRIADKLAVYESGPAIRGRGIPVRTVQSSRVTQTLLLPVRIGATESAE